MASNHPDARHSNLEARMKLKIAAALLLVISTTPASTESYEALVLKVDKALETTKVNSKEKEWALCLCDEGETLRASRGDCENALLQALKLLGEQVSTNAAVDQSSFLISAAMCGWRRT